MNRYYLPTEEEFEVDLELEVYDENENSWSPHTLNSNSKSAFLPLLKSGDIRVKYLDSQDFGKLGYTVKKTFLHEQENIIGYSGEVPVTEIINVYDEEALGVYKGGTEIGIFYPFDPKINLKINSKKYLIKNLTKLREILK